TSYASVANERPSAIISSVIDVVLDVIGPIVANRIAESGTSGATGDAAAVPAIRSIVALSPAGPPAFASLILSTIRSMRLLLPGAVKPVMFSVAVERT